VLLDLEADHFIDGVLFFDGPEVDVDFEGEVEADSEAGEV
jgi:hypothetical protein